MQLIEPKVKPPLDERFRPAVLANQSFHLGTRHVGVQAVIGFGKSRGRNFPV